MSTVSLKLMIAVATIVALGTKNTNQGPAALGAKITNHISGLKSVNNHTHGLQEGPCHCKIKSAEWVPSKRTAAKCIFIDLGASSGNDLQAFAEDKYGPLKDCPNGDWEAILVEANPSFTPGLKEMTAKFHEKVTLKTATAAYMCESKATFYLDIKDDDSSDMFGLGSDLNSVEVETLNIIRLLTEHTIPGDYVIMKMDVEGAEFDIIPCMAQAGAASLVDRMYINQHDPTWGLEGATLSSMTKSLAALRTRGIDIPQSDPAASASPY